MTINCEQVLTEPVDALAVMPGPAPEVAVGNTNKLCVQVQVTMLSTSCWFVLCACL